MTFAAAVLFASLATGCSVLRALDFGGSDDRPFEFRFGWERGIETGQGKPGTVDDRGVYRPETPEAEAVLGFPDVHAGMMVVVQPKGRVTPTVHAEIAEFKVPYLRWFSVQAGAGAQLADVYIGKRLVSVFEITAGGWFGRDFEEDAWAWGAGGTLIRF